MTVTDIARILSQLDRNVRLRPDIHALLTPNFLAALGYLVAVSLSELVTSLVNPLLGLGLHGITLFVMLIHAASTSELRLQRLIYSLTLAPLIRLVSLSLPLNSFPSAYWYVIVGAPLMLAAVVTTRLARVNRKMAGVTISQHPMLQLLIGLSGLVLGYLEYLILRPEPQILEFDWSQMLMPALVLLVFTGFLEEFIFRGVMQYSAQRALGQFGLVYISVLFAALHIGYKSILDLVYVFLVALFFGWATRKTNSLLGVTLAHGLINIGLFLIFPFIVAATPHLAPLPADNQFTLGQAVTPTAAPRPSSGLALWSVPPTNAPRLAKTTSPTPSSLPSHTPTQTAAWTATPTLMPTVCAPPDDWIAYKVQPGDSLAKFRRIYQLRKSRLLAANCTLDLAEVRAGQIFYLPHLPPTPVPYVKPAAKPAQPPNARPSPVPPSSRP